MKNKAQTKQGSTLLTVMIISIFVVSFAGGLISIAAQQTHSIKRQRDFAVARSLAEAGAAKAYDQIEEDWDSRLGANNFGAESLGDGQFNVSISVIDADSILINSVGTVNGVDADSVLEVRRPVTGTAATGPNPVTDPFAHAFYALGELRWNGNGTLNGNAYAGVNAYINGSSSWNANVRAFQYAEVIGGVTTFSGSIHSPSITGSGLGGVSNPVVGPIKMIPFPVLDLTGYYQTALENGQVSGGGTITSSIGAIPGGVRWFNGNVLLKNDVTYTGCVIATGNIIVKRDWNCTRSGDLPTLISRDGSITFQGERNASGLVYAKGDITLNGSGTFSGSMISGGNIRFNGSYGIVAYENSNPAGPDGPASGATGGGTYKLTWQK